jgi:hypothetical protein
MSLTSLEEILDILSIFHLTLLYYWLSTGVILKFFFKIVLLSILIVLIASIANAALIGGHDRQRLSLLFLSDLQRHFSQTPVAINPDIFPLDQQESAQSETLFNVLVEEGVLLRSRSAENVSNESVVMRRMFHYRVNPDASHGAFVLGYVEVQAITFFKAIPGHQPEQYKVSFQWHFVHPAEWLWAPAFADNSRIQVLLDSINHPHIADAVFVWQDGHWQVSHISSLY